MRRADSVAVMVCGDPDCKCVHLEFWQDGSEDPFAYAALPLDSVDGFMKDITEAVRRLVATKEVVQ